MHAGTVLDRVHYDEMKESVLVETAEVGFRVHGNRVESVVRMQMQEFKDRVRMPRRRRRN